MCLFRAIDKLGKIDKVNKANVVKMIKEEFPASKFSVNHATWYVNLYRRLAERKDHKKVLVFQAISKEPVPSTEGFILKI